MILIFNLKDAPGLKLGRLRNIIHPSLDTPQKKTKKPIFGTQNSIDIQKHETVKFS